MGGTLTLNLAARFPDLVAGIAPIAAAATIAIAPGSPALKIATATATKAMKKSARPGATSPRARKLVASSIRTSLSRSLSRVVLRARSLMSAMVPSAQALA